MCDSTYPESYIWREIKENGEPLRCKEEIGDQGQLWSCVKNFFRKMSDEACFSKKDIFAL